jgi:hypothetical protein
MKRNERRIDLFGEAEKLFTNLEAISDGKRGRNLLSSEKTVHQEF